LRPDSEGRMLTGDLRNKIDAVWTDFWSGGLSNPL
jgi:type I restriction enzyme M protein